MYTWQSVFRTSYPHCVCVCVVIYLKRAINGRLVFNVNAVLCTVHMTIRDEHDTVGTVADRTRDTCLLSDQLKLPIRLVYVLASAATCTIAMLEESQAGRWVLSSQQVNGPFMSSG